MAPRPGEERSSKRGGRRGGKARRAPAKANPGDGSSPSKRGRRGPAKASAAKKRPLSLAACGVVLLRRRKEDALEFLLLRRGALPTHPKGPLGDGEDEEKASMAYLAEKTGLAPDQVRLVKGFRHEERFVRAEQQRRVVMRAAVLADPRARVDAGADSAEWVTFSPPHSIHRSVDGALAALAEFLSQPQDAAEGKVAEGGERGGKSGEHEEAKRGEPQARTEDELYKEGLVFFHRALAKPGGEGARQRLLAAAEDIFRQAAEGGCARARSYQGRARMETDAAGAAEVFARGAREGDVASMYWFGLVSLYGVGVPREPAIAAPWFRRALPLLERNARRGDANSRFLLAECHFNGHGVPANRAAGLHWYKESARAGSEEARFWLARIPAEFPELADDAAL